MISMEEDTRDAVVIYASNPNRLDTEELLNKPAPRDKILVRGRVILAVKGETEFLYGGKLHRQRAAHFYYRLCRTPPKWTQLETRHSLANVFRLGQQRKAEDPIFKGHVNGVITFLYLVDKPGEVHSGRPKIVREPDVNTTERWG